MLTQLYLESNSMDYLLLAKQIVKHAFKDKVDLVGGPYYNHLEAVASMLTDKSTYLQTAAYLHDLLEDCPEWTEGALHALFPDEVVGIVVTLTRRPQEPYKAYIERVGRCPQATVIKLADLHDNMDVTRLAVLTDKDVERLRKYLDAYHTLKELV